VLVILPKPMSAWLSQEGVAAQDYVRPEKDENPRKKILPLSNVEILFQCWGSSHGSMSQAEAVELSTGLAVGFSLLR
jgi:hypothetical protein